jgi:hypothetical protein
MAMVVVQTNAIDSIGAKCNPNIQISYFKLFLLIPAMSTNYDNHK